MRREGRGKIDAGITACLLALVLAAWPAAAGETWGPFRGRFVDVETGQGIAGGVVLAVWYRSYPTIAGTKHEFFDARESVSSSDGYVTIPRREPPFFSLNIDTPSFAIFMPGYGEVHRLAEPTNGQKFIDPTVIELRKLKTREERLRNYHYSTVPVMVPLEKCPLYVQALRDERKALGLDR